MSIHVDPGPKHCRQENDCLMYSYKIQKEDGCPPSIENNCSLWPPPKKKLAAKDSVETGKRALLSISLLLDWDLNCRLSTRTISKKWSFKRQVLKKIVLSGLLPRRSWPPERAWRQEALPSVSFLAPGFGSELSRIKDSYNIKKVEHQPPSIKINFPFQPPTKDGNKVYFNLAQFACFWIRVRIRIPDTNTDLGEPNQYRFMRTAGNK